MEQRAKTNNKDTTKKNASVKFNKSKMLVYIIRRFKTLRLATRVEESSTFQKNNNQKTNFNLYSWSSPANGLPTVLLLHNKTPLSTGKWNVLECMLPKQCRKSEITWRARACDVSRQGVKGKWSSVCPRPPAKAIKSPGQRSGVVDASTNQIAVTMETNGNCDLRRCQFRSRGVLLDGPHQICA